MVRVGREVFREGFREGDWVESLSKNALCDRRVVVEVLYIAVGASVPTYSLPTYLQHLPNSLKLKYVGT